MHTQLSPRQLEAFLAVVEHGSMTRASQALEISQPAVSRLIADLTEALGFALFDRRDGRLVPTQEARFLLPDIRRSLDLLTRISETGRNITQNKAGELRIACLPGFAISHLPEVLAVFLEQRAGVRVTIEPDRPERILEWMVGEQFDVGITDGFEGHPAVESETIDIRTVCIFPQGHPLRRHTVIRPRDLADLKLIHTRRESMFYRLLSEAFVADGKSLNTFIEARQFTTACEFVRRGMGVSVISELDAAQYIGRGIEFRPFAPVIPHRLSLVRPIHKHPSMIALEFLEIFMSSLQAYAIHPDRSEI
ncbi:LysR substrate-binding domain-containing protein [Roseinatronobacter bogoriensis]|uniref:LysR family transcriptional regulator n=1 Tax=Roseinatronobacter bogoriensis subsp. barguzinensis TaxID=441209 RepID=A0A2K8KC05_9RHOB|nr:MULTISPECIES: LysR substrate-binding domain-containing protein [Rhodobaca]ATX66516.1 LysR family transcriptional regulator [Rhodobaca barguzinensis]MBB4207679.1 DNA-binding transcriptional LysR family regulator [Rhodobaca bogoriensis DSM 18756]TDW40014.1 DNA-binding transcriptional LysR family regulator [Rhodobaca barguzinensis]TDY70833.1 DNA-binding transcriptional LysR family regulator [Rhodobaca bogoriensis DSM 18756]